MSIARHHAEWLSLLEISGPFLSMPVLLNVFPQGLDAGESGRRTELRAAYEEWLDNQQSLRPESAIHNAWIRYVLQTILALPDDALAEGQAIPETLKASIPEHHVTIRPQIVIKEPPNSTNSHPKTTKTTINSTRPRMLIQVYPAAQGLERAVQNERWKVGPATRMMELLHATGVRLGLVTNGEQWMLVSAKRGETTGFVSWYASLWPEEPLTLRAFQSLLCGHRFFAVAEDYTLEAMLDESADTQQEVTDQLGYQVRQAVEILIQDIDRIDQDEGRTLLEGIGVDALYEAALTVMMRLVFLLAAEERGLLLLGDPVYDQNYAVSTLLGQQREMADRYGEEVLERRRDAWSRLLATFRAVYAGIRHEALNLRAYGGSLFDPDRFPFLEGRAAGTRWHETPAQPLAISNRTVLHLLEALQVLRVKVPGGGPAEARRLSFRALDIEQVGHVYEGLLDHVAKRAAGPVVGLGGTKNQEPEIPLSELEAQRERGEVAFVDYLREQTGRSPGALQRAAADDPDTERLDRAPVDLRERVQPFINLVRDDDYGRPVVIPEGSVYVTEGATRRATGTHYTPRSLTEPIVQHTLEPLIYHGPAEGEPRDAWELRPAADLLGLKVCDMAMGSGAFLVQACRYLAERLVEAWEAVAPPGSDLQITPEGRPSTGAPGETLIPRDPEERLAFARRLVADRCLYGVDKNRLAVEMAKLSLWLITLDKGRPFSFLDHALKHGDSLIGADEAGFRAWGPSREGQVSMFEQALDRALDGARARRRELQSFEVRQAQDAQRKAALLKEADAATARVRLGCDLLVGVRLLDDLSAAQQEELLEALLIDYMDANEKPLAGYARADDARRALEAARAQPAFHWFLEFPEVFEQRGFSAFVGNPPFIGGSRISTMFGNMYFQYIRHAFSSSHGLTDICALFFLQAFKKLRVDGSFGLIATNTIAQGDTRETGLDYIVQNDGQIYRAESSMPWPGVAAVYVSVVYVTKGKYDGLKILDRQSVSVISSYLDSTPILSAPKTLAENSGKSFIGSYASGAGFTMSPEEAQQLIRNEPRNADVLFPYLGGRDLNSTPHQIPSRWVIYFFDWSLEKAKQYPDCIKIVREKVYPVRQKNRNKQRREIWWRFTRPTIDLYNTIAPLKRVLCKTRHSPNCAFEFVNTGIVFQDSLVIFAISNYSGLAILSSTLHEVWAWNYGSTLKQDLRYSASDIFETFPFPPTAALSALDPIGEQYHETRRQIMLARQEGLTATYNRFHDPDEHAGDITELRRLHVAMDEAVAAAYGWGDLSLAHGFHETAQGVRYTISEAARREVLTRLLKLNHARYAEEIAAGLHEKGSKKKKGGGKRKKKRAGEDQPRLL